MSASETVIVPVATNDWFVSEIPKLMVSSALLVIAGPSLVSKIRSIPEANKASSSAGSRSAISKPLFLKSKVTSSSSSKRGKLAELMISPGWYPKSTISASSPSSPIMATWSTPNFCSSLREVCIWVPTLSSPAITVRLSSSAKSILSCAKWCARASLAVAEPTWPRPPTSKVTFRLWSKLCRCSKVLLSRISSKLTPSSRLTLAVSKPESTKFWVRALSSTKADKSSPNCSWSSSKLKLTAGSVSNMPSVKPPAKASPSPKVTSTWPSPLPPDNNTVSTPNFCSSLREVCKWVPIPLPSAVTVRLSACAKSMPSSAKWCARASLAVAEPTWPRPPTSKLVDKPEWSKASNWSTASWLK